VAYAPRDIDASLNNVVATVTTDSTYASMPSVQSASSADEGYAAMPQRTLSEFTYTSVPENISVYDCGNINVATPEYESARY
jgi:hypothetical protein